MERPGNFDSREADLEGNILGLFCDWGILKQEKEDRKIREGPVDTAGSQAGGPPSSNKELVSGEERTQVINKDFFIVFSAVPTEFYSPPGRPRRGQRRNKDNIAGEGTKITLNLRSRKHQGGAVRKGIRRRRGGTGGEGDEVGRKRRGGAQGGAGQLGG